MVNELEPWEEGDYEDQGDINPYMYADPDEVLITINSGIWRRSASYEKDRGWKLRDWRKNRYEQRRDAFLSQVTESSELALSGSAADALAELNYSSDKPIDTWSVQMWDGPKRRFIVWTEDAGISVMDEDIVTREKVWVHDADGEARPGQKMLPEDVEEFEAEFDFATIPQQAVNILQGGVTAIVVGVLAIFLLMN